MQTTIKKAIIIFLIGLLPLFWFIPNTENKVKEETVIKNIIDNLSYKDMYDYCGLFLTDMNELVKNYPEKYQIIQEYIDYYNKGELLALIETLNSEEEKKFTVNMYLNDIFSVLDENNITPQEVYSDWDGKEQKEKK